MKIVKNGSKIEHTGTVVKQHTWPNRFQRRHPYWKIPVPGFGKHTINHHKI